tara:strand:- start:3117 stop:3407 length:291 start_codon:yes stop_codon:yes gene_type:complete
MKTPSGKDTSGKGTTRRMDEEGLKLLGQRLKEIRKQKNMSQEDLADTSGLALSQIGRIERGVINATLSSVFALCRALDIEVAELMNFKLDKQDSTK